MTIVQAPAQKTTHFLALKNDLFSQAVLSNNNNNDWQLWQQHNHPIELRTPEMFHQKLQYIHDNPVEAGFAEKEEDYW